MVQKHSFPSYTRHLFCHAILSVFLFLKLMNLTTMDLGVESKSGRDARARWALSVQRLRLREGGNSSFSHRNTSIKSNISLALSSAPSLTP